METTSVEAMAQLANQGIVLGIETEGGAMTDGKTPKAAVEGDRGEAFSSAVTPGSAKDEPGTHDPSEPRCSVCGQYHATQTTCGGNYTEPRCGGSVRGVPTVKKATDND